MKKVTILIVILFSTISLFSQSSNKDYPFKVEVKGTGKPIVFIPGLSSPGSVWDETVKVLEKEHVCHVLTLSGFVGEAPIKFGEAFLPKIQAKIIEYIQEELTEQPIIIGHSLGGFMALSIASAEPDLLEKIVIVDAYPFYSAAMNPMATVEFVKVQAEMLKKSLMTMTDEAFADQQKIMMKSMATDAGDISAITQWSIDTDRATMAQAMYEIMTTDLRGAVKSVKCPILVFGSWYAAKDYGITKEVIEKNFQTQFSKAANCTIRIADTAKHFIMFDEPAWFIKNLELFL